MAANDLEKRLYNIWWYLSKKAHGGEFNSYQRFRAWALENGYQPEMILQKHDKEQPYSKGNCWWRLPEEKTETSDCRDLSRDWDRFIDRIRDGLGLPPIMTECPCTGCPKEDDCDDTICRARARWWDKKMKDIRKGFGYEL